MNSFKLIKTIILFVFGVGVLVFSGMNTLQATLIYWGKEAPGIVTSVKTSAVQRSFRRHSTHTYYQNATINYKYQVDGQILTEEFTMKSDPSIHADQKIKVYYAPIKPDYSIPDFRVENNLKGGLMGLLMGVVIMIIFFDGFREPDKNA